MTIDLASGVWAGYYEQAGRRFPQEMTLEFADGLIRGDGRDGLGTFTLDGEYRSDAAAVRLGWIKTYDGAHSVLYLGTLGATAIAGTWSLIGGTGKFALEPARRFEEMMR
nr:hypothetical protein [Kofleriaceae bacterium]